MLKYTSLGFFSLGGSAFGAGGRGFAAIEFATGGAGGATATGLATGAGATNGLTSVSRFC